MSINSLNKLAWTALVIADASAFRPTSFFRCGTNGIISSSSRHHRPLRQQQQQHQQQVNSNATPRDLWYSVARERGGVRRSYGGVVQLLGKKPAQGEEGIDLAALKELKQRKLAEWQAMIESGELEEATRDAVDMDVMEQEEALEVGSRRTKRKDRIKEELGAKGGRQAKRAKYDDLSDLEEMFGGSKQDDWRDGAATGSDSGSPKRKPARGTAAEKRSGSNDDGNERAMKLVAGLGLEVVPSNAQRLEVQEEEEAEEERIGGVDGVNEKGHEDGVRKLIMGIRKHEKGGKENAEKVIAMVVSAAERDGVRDDNLFSFAVKSLARMGRLDLSLRVHEMRDRYIKSGQLCNHDRSVTSGLSVALLRAGDGPAALDVFEAAVTPAPSLLSPLALEGDDDRDEVELDEDDVVAAEAEVLPELLSFYLERAQRENSQEASKGVRQAIDRALRRRDFDPEGGAAMTEENWGILSRPLPVTAYNQLIRRLGKAERLSDVFEVLDRMAELEVAPDHETLEFVTNAAVKEVEFETRAVSMKTLPTGMNALPEVVFVGRSNVGKSSLVNMLVNRKALAPTSATPGFTQHFNYYAVNKGRRRSPSFFLVDVPGLGYARADDGRMDSWKSTLQRYLGVRETLKVVFHLVDVRTGLQTADVNLISLMMNENKGRSSYVMVITKCDKVSQNKLVEVEKEIRKALDESGFPASIPVIATSSKSKMGRVELLSYLRLVFDVDRRKKGSGRGSCNDAGDDQATTGAALSHEKQALPSQT